MIIMHSFIISATLMPITGHSRSYMMQKGFWISVAGILTMTSEYQLLIRLLKEQTTFHNDGTRRLREKKEKEDPSKVLLNPSDPEATFRKKGWQ